MRKKHAAIILMILMLLTACSNSGQNPVSEEEARSIDVSKYFPAKPGTTLVYETYGPAGEVVSTSYQVVKQYGSSMLRNEQADLTLAVVDKTKMETDKTLTLESVTVYQVSSQEIRQIHTQNNALNLNPDRQIVSLMNTPSWQADEETKATITGFGKTVSTSIGKFTDCIELHEVTESQKGTRVEKKVYRAPDVGIVRTEVKLPDGKDFTAFTELVEYRVPNGERQNAEKTDENGHSQTENGAAQGTETEYVNQEFGFHLQLPEDWANRYRVKEDHWAQDMVKTIDFSYDPGNGEYYGVFSVLVKKGEMSQEEWNAQGYSEGGWRYIMAKDGYTFSYVPSMEPPAELLDGTHQAELDELSRVINETVSSIFETFQ
ncbi:hypothetical protein [Brevibacillus choshinensis]|uniref:Uncharacterized protein n=1 Tax=Brevibacillus choshinensis TaxID=54911 RepID=A0ABX7FTH7_BRECH|nr:hypothetical protein [Brevibacillus choshinensis]QRG68952.1 hypothetical protein JNE38_07375 [Brevibacillus choshinensis]